MWCIICVTTEEPTTIKVNEVLVRNEACWQCAGPLPFSRRPQTTCLIQCEPIHQQRKERLHKHVVHLDDFRIQTLPLRD